jgi:hypothetical protein
MKKNPMRPSPLLLGVKVKQITKCFKKKNKKKKKKKKTHAPLPP